MAKKQKKKVKSKLPPDLEGLFDDRAQKDVLYSLVMEEDAGTDVFRAIWRRLFNQEIPPWIITAENEEKLRDPGPYAIKAFLTGEICPVCGRPLYLTGNKKGVVCAGGHGEEQRQEYRKKSKERKEAAKEMVHVAIDDDDFFD